MPSKMRSGSYCWATKIRRLPLPLPLRLQRRVQTSRPPTQHPKWSSDRILWPFLMATGRKDGCSFTLSSPITGWFQ
jgi:hypothetical protein